MLTRLLAGCLTLSLIQGVPPVRNGVAVSAQPLPPGSAARSEGLLRARVRTFLSPEGEAHLARLARASGARAAPAGGGVVTFDRSPAPCLFVNTQPLAGTVEGVLVKGRAPNGAAILHECSQFGVAPLSGVNFLAFNREVAYSTGGLASAPELFLFPGEFTSVRVPIASGVPPTEPLALIAFGPRGIVAGKTLRTTEGWATHTLSGEGITGLLILDAGDTESDFVVDDIRYD